MKTCRITGWGTYLPDDTVTFATRSGTATRYRVADDVSQLDMLVAAADRAIRRADLGPDDVDCVIAACAAGVQPIPCTAALVMERVAPGARAAAFDVNSTCTSFITALDIASRYLADGVYEHVLIVSGDVGSRFLDPAERESWELFSDAAAAVVVSRAGATPADRPDVDARPDVDVLPDVDVRPGVLASLQQTWPAHAHDTELRGGLSRFPAQDYADGDPADYRFDMHGRRALMGMLRVLPGFFERFFTAAGIGVEDLDLVVPHQASGALGIAMRRVGIPDGAYVDAVAEYGNMVSASVPYTLATCLDDGRVRRGDTVLLCGTAAGLTANALALRL
ncbi:3-oxoacyl-[acyl-carrier-protein] synthase III C-terminal domain-containing protein [Curtobacterium sp. MCLR17_007]|uniref:3-oxoacyl-[acyl-carrier-protein] synthase III C-terminal domain-containing protein n=1 Tax=Curtobacterium sp. MCLR17_007 TaxID=2175648 RepID=UPI000DA9DDE3|nr:3-oxoacyl-[acyl-carrier-protein] synthase III C-terminal domain-containing protein [Curtobacterium sp. MCLR17_007]WIB61314.1 3-oxoacyl-[acyl-carrier-protein] synthase III C-terminal domain-containing protein [Curtobacterium sp. MCLR17_007]